MKWDVKEGLRPPVPLLAVLALSLLLVGCEQQLGINAKRKIPLPAAAGQVAFLVQKPEVTTVVVTTEAVKETGLDLDGYKARAVEGGYAISDLFDFQKQFADGIEGGFNVQIGDYYMPVMAFGSPEDARNYATAILEAGYNLPILSGKYLAMVSADGGVVRDPEQQAIMEAIMGEKIWTK